MAPPAITKYAIEGLNEAREDLLSIAPAKLDFAEYRKWLAKWRSRMDQAQGACGSVIYHNLANYIKGHEASPYDVVLDVRSKAVALIDAAKFSLDSTVTVVPVLEGLIEKVKDTKLATLLNEFNRGKDANPNISAIGFRTILMIIIQEQAKRKDPAGALATKQDLNLNYAIDTALSAKLFDSGEERLLSLFKSGGQKAVFDNITHKPGANALIDKDYLSHAVELLNKLLPVITS